MDKQTQIEEMANIMLEEDFYTQKELDTARSYAEALYKAGYRKVEKPQEKCPPCGNKKSLTNLPRGATLG